MIATRALVPWLAAAALTTVGAIALLSTDDGRSVRVTHFTIDRELEQRALDETREAARMHAHLGRMQAELMLIRRALEDAIPTMSLRHALADHRSDFAACIDAFLVDHPMARNRSTILAHLDETGRLVDLNVSVAAGGYKTAEACVADVMRQIVVSERNHDVILGITYEAGEPLSFGVTFRDGYPQ